MKIPVVDQCLCCHLETAGKILGWLGTIFGIIFSLIISFLLIVAIVFPCNEIMNTEGLNEISEVFPIKDCTILKAVVIILVLLLLIMVLAHTVIDILLLNGILNRNPGRIIPAVIIQALYTVSVFAKGIMQFSIGGLISGLLSGAISCYFFIVLYSLYVKIRDEKRVNQNIQFSQP